MTTATHKKTISELLPKSLTLWCLFALIIPNIILSITEQMPLLMRVANIVLPLGLFGLALTATRKIGKTVWCMFPFIFIAAFQLVLLNLYGRSVIAVDMFLNVVTTNPSEATELLSNLLWAITQVIILYLTPLIAAVICIHRRLHNSGTFFRKVRQLSGISTLAGFVLVAAAMINNSAEANPVGNLFPLNGFENAAIAVKRYNATRNYAETSKDFTFGATATHPDSIREVYVIVIGETSRAENWQLSGYTRETNPNLVNIQHLTYYPKTLSESNTTHKSVPMLLSHTDASNFGHSIDSIKSVITAFEEAGFDTHFISAQKRNRSYIDFFGEEADSTVFIYEDIADETRDRDLLLTDYLSRALETPKSKVLIVVHTYGSHYNYADRYDATFRKFTPDSPISASLSHRNELINAYDNSILKTDHVISSMIEKLQNHGAHSALIYASDHGEDIYDDSRELFLHASPLPTFHQIYVPMLVWTSESYNTMFPEVIENLHRNKDKNVSSTRSMFHTIVDLAGLTMPVLDRSASLASDSYKEPQRIYLSDHNEKVGFADGYLSAPDFEQLRKRGMFHSAL